MKKYVKYLCGSLIGAACLALPVVLSRVLIRNLAVVFSRTGPILSLDQGTIFYGIQILSQLQSAVIVSPWLPFLLGGAVLGGVAAWLTDRRPVRHVFVFVLLGLLLLLLLSLFALWFTSVNDISVGLLIQSILPTLSHLL